MIEIHLSKTIVKIQRNLVQVSRMIYKRNLAEYENLWFYSLKLNDYSESTKYH